MTVLQFFGASLPMAKLLDTLPLLVVAICEQSNIKAIDISLKLSF